MNQDHYWTNGEREKNDWLNGEDLSPPKDELDFEDEDEDY
jgi:hypothetical protein